MMEGPVTSIVASAWNGLFRVQLGVLRGLRIWSAAFAVEAKLRLLRGPIYFDLQVGSRSMLGKEGIGGPENPSFPAGHGLRDLRGQFERSMEIDIIFGQIVIAGDFDIRAGHVERHGPEGHELVFQAE